MHLTRHVDTLGRELAVAAEAGGELPASRNRPNGAIEAGIRGGTSAWLDVNSGHGQTGDTLTAAETPEATEDTLKVRARSRYGGIGVRRARS